MPGGRASGRSEAKSIDGAEHRATIAGVMDGVTHLLDPKQPKSARA